MLWGCARLQDGVQTPDTTHLTQSGLPSDQEGSDPLLFSVFQVGGYIYSGSTGHQIGHRGSLGVGGTAGSLLHVTRAGAHYILFPCGMWRLPFPGLSVSWKPCTREKAEGGTGDRRQDTSLSLTGSGSQRVSAPEAQGGHRVSWKQGQGWRAPRRQRLEALLCFQQQAPSAAAL